MNSPLLASYSSHAHDLNPDTTCNDQHSTNFVQYVTEAEMTGSATGLSPAPVYSAEAAAPVMISTSSPVMTAWRVRLNRI